MFLEDIQHFSYLFCNGTLATQNNYFLEKVTNGDKILLRIRELRRMFVKKKFYALTIT